MERCSIHGQLMCWGLQCMCVCMRVGCSTCSCVVCVVFCVYVYMHVSIKVGSQSDASTSVALRSVVLLRITSIENVLFELAIASACAS